MKKLKIISDCIIMSYYNYLKLEFPGRHTSKNARHTIFITRLSAPVLYYHKIQQIYVFGPEKKKILPGPIIIVLGLRPTPI